MPGALKATCCIVCQPICRVNPDALIFHSQALAAASDQAFLQCWLTTPVFPVFPPADTEPAGRQHACTKQSAARARQHESSHAAKSPGSVGLSHCCLPSCSHMAGTPKPGELSFSCARCCTPQKRDLLTRSCADYQRASAVSVALRLQVQGARLLQRHPGGCLRQV